MLELQAKNVSDDAALPKILLSDSETQVRCETPLLYAPVQLLTGRTYDAAAGSFPWLHYHVCCDDRIIQETTRVTN